MSFIFLEYERLDGHISCHELFHLNLRSVDLDGVVDSDGGMFCSCPPHIIGSKVH